MVMQDDLLRIFWPLETLRSAAPGTLVGWRNSESDIFVVSILEDAEPRAVDNALRVGHLFRGSPYPISTLLQACGHSHLQVLGVVNPYPAPSSLDPCSIVAYTNEESDTPRIQTSLSLQSSVQVIAYARPLPARMQYVSLEPIALALKDKHDNYGSDMAPYNDELDQAEQREAERKSKLVHKLQLHTVNAHIPSQKELALEKIMNQINCSFELNESIQKNAELVRRRARRTLSVSERVAESASNLWDYVQLSLSYLYVKVIWPAAARMSILIFMCHRMFGELIILGLNWRPGSQKLALRDVSATAQQVDLRLQQFCYWPIQYITLRKRRTDWASTAKSNPEYIRFYNSFWLVANDAIIGIAIGTYIIENADYVAAGANTLLTTWLLDGLRRSISWLMVNPAGLKLNNELARFLGDLFLWVIDYWSGCMVSLLPYFPHIFRFIGFASFGGATMALSLLSDLLSLTTLHVHCFYIAAARIYSWQLTTIISLFHLFRGKKRNVLRNRIDSCDYELDQLLLGTILFTLLTFLLPTVIVFYLNFALARMSIIAFKASLDSLLACLNHFPLFAIMLRIKDPWRLPGGIRFELQRVSSLQPVDADVRPRPTTSLIRLTSVPLPLGSIFHEYSTLTQRIKRHYLAPSVILCLATGGFVPPLHRKNLYALQYSALPAVRASISDLLDAFNEALKQKPQLRALRPIPAIGLGMGKVPGLNGLSNGGLVDLFKSNGNASATSTGSNMNGSIDSRRARSRIR